MTLIVTNTDWEYFSRASNRTFQLFHVATVPTAKEKCFSDWKERFARGHADVQSDVEISQTRWYHSLTLCHCRPTKTPTRFCEVFIGVEVDFHFVRFGRYDRRLEVQGIRWISIWVAAAVVHQGRPVPIGDSHKVGWAGGDIAINMDGKGGEFKPQYLSSLHSNVFYFVNVIGIVARMVWWGDHTWEIVIQSAASN